ncbi:MAG: porin, partial [Polyangiaceae bacterium]|nr:porin [Polyangiaceae bacterium]
APEPPKTEASAEATTETADAAAEGAKAEGEGEKKEAHWYDRIDVSAFVDAYFSLNMNFPRPHADANYFRGNDIHDGFSLAWVGLDATYEADPVGATINLRFGPQTPGYAGYDTDIPGLQHVRQAFATWKPTEKLTLDLGKFDTFAGAEAIDSQWNFNYTRGILHWLGQPTFHTGLRATYTISDMVSVLAFVANGTSRTVDNNVGKTFGLQASVSPIEELTLNLGYIGGPEQDDFYVQEFDDGTSATLNVGTANNRWRHVIDFIATYDPNEKLSLVFNADYGRETLKPDLAVDETVDVQWLGFLLAGRYAVNETFAAALRGEFYKDFDGYTSGTELDTTILTGTLTVEASPSPHLSIKLDLRGDYAIVKAPEGEPDPEIFLKGANETSKVQPTLTLGVVAKTN